MSEPRNYEEALRDARVDDDLVPTLDRGVKAWYDAVEELEGTKGEVHLWTTLELKALVRKLNDAIEVLWGYEHYMEYYEDLKRELG